MNSASAVSIQLDVKLIDLGHTQQEKTLRREMGGVVSDQRRAGTIRKEQGPSAILTNPSSWYSVSPSLVDRRSWMGLPKIYFFILKKLCLFFVASSLCSRVTSSGFGDSRSLLAAQSFAPWRGKFSSVDRDFGEDRGVGTLLFSMEVVLVILFNCLRPPNGSSLPETLSSVPWSFGVVRGLFNTASTWFAPLQPHPIIASAPIIFPRWLTEYICIRKLSAWRHINKKNLVYMDKGHGCKSVQDYARLYRIWLIINARQDIRENSEHRARAVS
jgi:hypothetical protein